MLQCELHETMAGKVDDHELRIRILEEAKTRMEIQFANIGKNQQELKATVLDINREYTKQLDTFYNKIADMLSSTISTSNKIRLIDRKEFWITVATILTIAGGMAGHFIK